MFIVVNHSPEAIVHDEDNCEPYHEKGRVGHTTSSWDDLSSSSMNGFISDHRIQDLKLHITNSCVCVCACGRCECVCVYQAHVYVSGKKRKRILH